MSESYEKKKRKKKDLEVIIATDVAYLCLEGYLYYRDGSLYSRTEQKKKGEGGGGIGRKNGEEFSSYLHDKARPTLSNR